MSGLGIAEHLVLSTVHEIPLHAQLRVPVKLEVRCLPVGYEAHSAIAGSCRFGPPRAGRASPA